jgi:DNA modification methylase
MPEPYYQSDGIVLYNCDWRDLDPALLKADALIVDPPYGLGEAAGNNKSRTKLAIAKDYGDDDWDNEPPSEEDIEAMCTLAPHQIIWGGNYFHLPPSRCWLVWDKVNGENDFADCELAWTNLDKAVRLYRYMWNGMLKENPEVRVHPTQKPRALLSWCLTLLPKDVKSVVDVYAGSGTVAVACKAMGLSCVCVEREEKYCAEIVTRLRQQVFTFAP